MSGDGGHGHDDDEIHEEHEEHANHEAWVIPYADLLTLLMAMFIALFAISSVNVDKAKRLELGFNNAGKRPQLGLFTSSPGKSPVDGVGQGATGGKGILSGSDNNKPNTPSQSSVITPQQAIQNAVKKERTNFGNLETQIKQAAAQQGVAGEITYELQGRGLVIRLVNDNVLFASGQANIEPEGARVLHVLGTVLHKVTNPLLIEGYTDDRPISTPLFASNWELSTSRADVVLRFLVDVIGLDETRMTAQGFGAHYPVASNATDAGRAKNRRVEIVVESKIINEILTKNGLTNQAVDPSSSASSNKTTPTTAKPNLKNVVGKLGVDGN